MSRAASPAYWAIAPFHADEPDILEQTWAYDQHHGVIAIGWHEVVGVRDLTRNQLQVAMSHHYPDEPGGWRSIWAFYNEIQIDDLIVARTGRSTVLGLGRVTSDAYFDEVRGLARGGGTRHWYEPHFRKVEWISTERHFFPHLVFAIATVSRIGKHLPEILDRMGLARA